MPPFQICSLMFAITTREHLETVIEIGADGGVVGSKIVSVIQDGSTEASEIAERVQRYVSSLTGRGDGSEAGPIKSPPSSHLSLLPLPLLQWVPPKALLS